jgi:hypothetical protein
MSLPPARESKEISHFKESLRQKLFLVAQKNTLGGDNFDKASLEAVLRPVSKFIIFALIL